MRSATIYTTGACNLRCKHCAVGADQNNPRPHLSTDEIRDTITNLVNSGVTYITLLGGETTVFRKDLYDILVHAEKHGAFISINTNLYAFEDFAYCLDILSLKSIVVSLDGAQPQTHNAMRGRGTFERTIQNIRKVVQHNRCVAGDLRCEITFVLCKLNLRDNIMIIQLAEELGVDKLNINYLKSTGRAEKFSNILNLTDIEFVNGVTEILIYWLLRGNIKLDMYVPPALAYFLERKHGINKKIANFSACGGPYQSYGYVDLKGNHLPCPAMSKEEDINSQLEDRISALDITTNKASEIWKHSIFSEFENDRINGQRKSKTFPCNMCRFKEICSPCTTDVIKNHQDPRVDICSSLFATADELLPGIKTEIFTGATEVKDS